MTPHQQLQHQLLKGGQLACICKPLQPRLPRLTACANSNGKYMTCRLQLHQHDDACVCCEVQLCKA